MATRGDATAAPEAPPQQSQRLKYRDLNLHIDANFWQQLENEKLHNWKLNEPTVDIALLIPSLSYREVTSQLAATSRQPSRVLLVADSLKRPNEVSQAHHTRVRGTLLNFNTFQQLHDLDKKQALIAAGNRIAAEILDPSSSWNAPLPPRTVTHKDSTAEAATGPHTTQTFFFSSTVTVAMFTFADLKTHEFHYCAAFPALDVESPLTVRIRQPASHVYSAKTTQDAIWKHAMTLAGLVSEAVPSAPFVLARASSSSSPPRAGVDPSVDAPFIIAPFHSSTTTPSGPTSDFVIVFADSSTSEEYPGWAFRNIAAAVRLTHPRTTVLRFLALRETFESSLYFVCDCEALSDEFLEQHNAARGYQFKCGGWVDTAIHKVEMGSVMDPVRLAESSAKLNLSLMKWRMLPNLQLEPLQGCSALLLGSGTLGCNIARHLLMWGVTTFTLVDRGNVSFSNPVRQTLFELSDVLAEGEKRCKSVAAANAVKRILPSANVSGVNLTIRMPGHRVSPGTEDAAKADIAALEQLILKHDVVFLLTDSRESRWLPSLLCALHNKPVINTALGFDTYVVMRHGVRDQDGGRRLGCYFCNDVVAPKDSLTARSLDQQCTVTRPGVSAMASALSVEMLAALYNHDSRFRAAAHVEGDDGDAEEACDNPLGIIPHQVRGNVYNYSMRILNGSQYDKCTACSDAILQHVRGDGGYDFIIRCLNDPVLMEEVTGLKADKEAAEAKYQDWDDDTAFDD